MGRGLMFEDHCEWWMMTLDNVGKWADLVCLVFEGRYTFIHTRMAVQAYTLVAGVQRHLRYPTFALGSVGSLAYSEVPTSNADPSS